MKMEIYKYLRNECMDIKRSVGVGGAFLCTQRCGSFQLSFFVTAISTLNTRFFISFSFSYSLSWPINNH